MFDPEKLKKLRLQRGFSLRQLAVKTGLSFGYLGNLEKGKVNPSLETVEKLAKALKVPPEHLLGRETGERKPASSPIDLDEALDDLLSRADVMFDGLSVGELDEDIKKDLRAAVRAILEYEMRRRGKEAGPPKGRAAAATSVKAEVFVLAESA